jgi:hypothetical protein
MASLPQDRSAVPLGFTGLASLVSDVDGLIATAKKTAASRSSNQAGAPAHSGAAGGAPVSSRPSVAQTSEPRPTAAWFWGTVAVVVAVALTAVVFNNNASPTPSSQPSDAARTHVPTAREEQLPPVGVKRELSAPEILYCVSEYIRLEAARDIVSTPSDVDRYNKLVRDYSSRCVNSQYRRSVLESVQRQVEANRTSLQIDGIARFQR